MLKRMYLMVENTLLRIPGVVIIAAVLASAYFVKRIGIMIPVSSNFWENMFCEQQLLITWLPVSILILLSGVGVAHEDDAVRYVRMKNRVQLCLVNLLSAFAAVLMFSLLFVFGCFVYFRLTKGYTLENAWSVGLRNCPYESVAQVYPTPAVVSSFSPIWAFGMKFLFSVIYSTFLAIFSMTLNMLFKQSVGSIFCALTIVSAALFGNRMMGEYSFYPWYNGNFKALTESNTLEPVGWTILYWAVALTTVIALYCLVMHKCDLISLSREDK